MKNILTTIVILLYAFGGYSQNLNAGLLLYIDGEGNNYSQDKANVGIDNSGGGNMSRTPDALGIPDQAIRFWGGALSFLEFETNGLIDFGTTGSFSFVTDFKSILSGDACFFTDYNPNLNKGWYVGQKSVSVGSFTFEMGATTPISISTTNIFNDNVWHQGIVTVNRSTNIVRMYVDGVLQDIFKNGTSAGTIVNGNELDITGTGANGTPGLFDVNGDENTRIGNTFQGSLDETRIYNRVLTLAEIALLYNNSFVLSTEEELNSLGISVYPNPVGDNINISFKNNAQAVSLSLRNNIGQVVFCGDVEGAEYRMPAANLPKGVYFLEIVYDNKILNTRIVK